MSKGKVTVSIDKELLKDLDRAARLQRESRSSVLEKAIRTWRKARPQSELIEGYRAMAQEDLRVAEQNLHAGYEALK